MNVIREKWNTASEFMRVGVWDIDINSLDFPRRIGLRGLRVLRMVFSGFREDKLSLHASSLTFASLMSLVPALAISFAVLKGMGHQKTAIRWVESNMTQMPEQFQATVKNNIIQPVIDLNFAALGSVGLLILLYSVVRMLGSIELSFNSIWGITNNRTFLRKCTDYISIVVIVPILVIAGITMRTSGMAIEFEAFPAFTEAAAGLWERTLKLSGLFTSWIGFIFLFMFMPNTRVKFAPAALSGLACVFLVSTWQWIYITFQIGITNNNKIFGTFAAVPIFLAWLYVTWILVLLGAEICFAMQSSTSFAMEQKSDDASPLARVKVALAVVVDAAQSLMNGRQPFTIERYAETHRVPMRLLNSVTEVLQDEGFLVEVKDENGTFVLSKAPEMIATRDVALAVLDHGSDAHDLGLGDMDVLVDVALEDLDQSTGKEKTIRDIVGALPS